MKKLFLAAAVLISMHGLAQSFTPVVKLTAGKRYMVNTTNKGSISQEAMGQTMEIPMDVSIYSTLEVKAANTEGAQLSSTTSRLTLSVSMMGQDMNYDSDKKEDRDGQMGEALNDQINQTVTFKIDPGGKVISSTVVKPAIPKNDAATSNPMLSMLGLSETALGLSPAVNLFNSGAEIKVGSSFTDDNGTSADGKIKTAITYTLAEIKDGIASFTLSGTSIVVKEVDMQGMQGTVNTSSKLTGEMLVDAVTGLLIKKTVSSSISGNTEIAGMSIPQSGTMVVTVTVTEMK